MAEKKTSQIGATAEGAVFLRRLAGRSLETGAKKDPETAPTAPFNEMKDAYRALFVYGLVKGERLPTKKGQSFSTIYANIGMLIDNYDFEALLSSMGSEEDLKDIGKSINEYTNWAIEELRRGYSADTFNLSSQFTSSADGSPVKKKVVKRRS
jgi:hypothetical protein